MCLCVHVRSHASPGTVQALVKRKNKNASESSENSSSSNDFEKKNLLKLALVQPLKGKIQMQQKTLKTLVLIKLIKGKINQKFAPHESLKKKNSINQKILRPLIL